MNYDSTVKCHELNEILEDSKLRIFDCRHYLKNTDLGRLEFEISHIPAAIFVHLDDDLSDAIIPEVTGRHPMKLKEDFTRMIQYWGVHNEDQIVIYDQSHGGIAARLWWMFKWAGHKKVAVLEGGFQKWIDEYSILSTEHTVYPKSSFKTNFDDDLIVSVGEVLEISKKTRKGLLVDSRGTKRYQGLEEPIDPIAGHIPNAINRPFMNNLNNDAEWKSHDELKIEFKQIMEQSYAQNAIFYCGSGVTACHNLISYYKLTGQLAKLYPGSWSHYITNSNRPIASKAKE